MNTPIPYVAPSGIMRGGFLPVPAAASVGLLLFTTSTFVSEAYTRGQFLNPVTAGAWLSWKPGLRCRWTSVEDANWQTKWGARFDRMSAAEAIAWGRQVTITGKNTTGQCYMGKHSNGLIPQDFTSDEVFQKGDHLSSDDSEPWSVVAAKKIRTDIPLVSPVDQPDKICFYQCVAYNAVSLPALISSIGSIAAGSGIVVVASNWVSTNVGPRMITEKSEPADLLRNFQLTDHRRCIHSIFRSFGLRQCYTLCAVVIAIIYAIMKQVLIARLNADGIYTVDYYVTFVMMFSITMVVVIRCINPYRCSTQMFTKAIWQEGKDKFVVTRRVMKKLRDESGEEEWKTWEVDPINENCWMMTLDLVQWIHLTRDQRAELLVDYARRPHKANTDPHSVEDRYMISIASAEVLESMECGGSWHGTGYSVKIAWKQKLELVAWKSDTRAILKIPMIGDDGKIILDQYAQREGKVVYLEMANIQLLEDDPPEEALAKIDVKDRQKDRTDGLTWAKIKTLADEYCITFINEQQDDDDDLEASDDNAPAANQAPPPMATAAPSIDGDAEIKEVIDELITNKVLTGGRLNRISTDQELDDMFEKAEGYEWLKGKVPLLEMRFYFAKKK